MNELARENLVLKFAERYLINNIDSPRFAIPSVEYLIDELLYEKPKMWWGDEQDVLEWAIRARDEIIEGRNYVASRGRGLHDEPVDPWEAA
jgi:hypothetical protein